jgi:hypothetical protein
LYKNERRKAMSTNDWIVLIGVIASIGGVSIGYVSYMAGKNKEAKKDGREDGKLRSDNEYLKRRTDDILLEVKDTNKTLTTYGDRLARVEESAKSAHHRIDEIKKEVN